MSQTPTDPSTGPITADLDTPAHGAHESVGSGQPSSASNAELARQLELGLCADPPMSAATARELIMRGRADLARRFEQGEPAASLIRDLTVLIDGVVLGAWASVELPGACLAAVGGYGRKELLPASDVDILVLVPHRPEPAEETELQQLVTRLWDCGLEIGHSVRTIAECVSQARQDITVATAQLESRLLAGSAELFEQMRSQATGPAVMSSRAFFDLKLAEQNARHQRFDETAYKLEPNVKESPGGLRDIQSIVWVAKHHFGGQALSDLVSHGFLEPVELDVLEEGRDFLWQVRFALHTMTGRREDRLLFDHQRTLATRFGYQDDDANLAVEQFMQRYYRTARELQQLNELLLEVFKEANLSDRERRQVIRINRRFRAVNGIIEAIDDRIFFRQPWTMLELFLLKEQHPEVTGISPATLRLLRSSRHRLDERNRADIRARSLFMEILRQPRGVSHALRHMHRHGVLAAYLPVFEQVSGKMQYDLFHIYTVDEHSLRVLANVRAYADEEPNRDLAALSDIFERLPKRELLYIAALFHDIAKGRGGDHS
ncbi:MAG: [protein-PII] uridylyltransferase, partial [Gammaproteobacteria bacterium]|nr:[protein-PII] uridylyltransferase [Gammaproteobacteria bacterium]